MVKIEIGNGHGIGTLGKASPYALYGRTPELHLQEWKWTREIAAAVVCGLRNRGYDAELLVPECDDVPLKKRVERVNSLCRILGKDNVLLVSIHGDAFGDGREWNSANGWTAYTSPGQTKSDRLAECLYDRARENFKGRKIRTDRTDGDSDKEERFYILTQTACPAVLTENFFYTNIEDCAYMLSEEGKEAIVKTHIEGIIKYCREL